MLVTRMRDSRDCLLKVVPETPQAVPKGGKHLIISWIYLSFQNLIQVSCFQYINGFA